jgi:type IV secretory pathway protease TraF
MRRVQRRVGALVAAGLIALGAVAWLGVWQMATHGYRIVQARGPDGGLWLVRPVTSGVRVGDVLLVALPETAAAVAMRRQYVSYFVKVRGLNNPVEIDPVLRIVVATRGMTVCWDNRGMRVEGILEVERAAHDPQGRPMTMLPGVEGCRVLRDEVVLIGKGSGFVYDSRYFGEVPLMNVIGTTTRLCGGWQ